MTVKDLRNALSEVAKTGDVANIRAAVKALDEAEKVQAKELKAKADAEFEAKSAARLELTERIKATIGKVADSFREEVVKLVGLDEAVVRWSVDYKNGNLIECSILRTKPRAASTGTGGTPRGATKNEYGLSLGQVFEKFASDQDKLDYEKATSGSGQWQIKVRVKKQAIEAGLLKPVS